MNVEIGPQAVQFLEKEYINGVFVAVHSAYTQYKLNPIPLILSIS